ncbi:hypothetical protein AABM17_793 [Neisseria musculi]|uniref:Uncharacterized protein n=1 Tax=Neisseria musculi TaxID=1815583 RepID=A0A7H1MC29_9NEIS|nr:hypothetical protein H7A79_0793 [Neisseria musculi]
MLPSLILLFQKKKGWGRLKHNSNLTVKKKSQKGHFILLITPNRSVGKTLII